MNFERGKDPKEALSIGGYGFDTLRRGAIIEVLHSFGVSKEEGKLRHVRSCSVALPKGTYILVLRDVVEDENNQKKKFIPFLKQSNLHWIEEDRERLERGEAFPGWRTTGHIGSIFKKQFDNRMKIIRPGF